MCTFTIATIKSDNSGCDIARSISIHILNGSMHVLELSGHAVSRSSYSKRHLFLVK